MSAPPESHFVSPLDVDQALIVALRLALLDTDARIYQCEDHILRRFLAEFRSIEQAKSRLVAAFAWRAQHGIDKLLWTWPAHQGSKESLIKCYWPGAIMDARTHDGAAVQFHRMSCVDFVGLDHLQLITVAVLHLTWLNEISLQIDPRGVQLMIFDLGFSEEDVSAERVVQPMTTERFKAVIAFARAMSMTVADYAPKIFRRIYLVRARWYIQEMWEGLVKISPWWIEAAKVVSIHEDCALPELLKQMPVEAVPECLGGKCNTGYGTGGFLVSPSIQTLQTPVLCKQTLRQGQQNLLSGREHIKQEQAMRPPHVLAPTPALAPAPQVAPALLTAGRVAKLAIQAAQATETIIEVQQAAATEQAQRDAQLEAATSMVQARLACCKTCGHFEPNVPAE